LDQQKGAVRAHTAKSSLPAKTALYTLSFRDEVEKSALRRSGNAACPASQGNPQPARSTALELAKKNST